MKPAAPAVVRKGSVVRVHGGPRAVGAVTVVLSYVDLRYDDGHVERWIGPGCMYALPGGDGVLETLNAWGEDVIALQWECLVEEVAMDFRDVSAQDFVEAPVEIVFEWNANHDLPEGAPLPPL
jgi:hypothetical protein